MIRGGPRYLHGKKSDDAVEKAHAPEKVATSPPEAELFSKDKTVDVIVEDLIHEPPPVH